MTLLAASGPTLDLNALWANIVTWAQDAADAAFSWGTTWQALAVLAAAALAFLASRYPVARLRRSAADPSRTRIVAVLLLTLARVLWPAFTVVLLWVATAVYQSTGLANEGLRVAASLLNAWIVVRLVTSTMKDGFWASTVALFAWTIAALYIVRLLDPVARSLDGAAIVIGDFRLSVLRVLTSIAIAAFALWAGRLAGDAVQSRLKSSRSLTPSIAGLLGQVLKIAFMVLAVVITLYSIGINLTALTVLSGAIGVGIGFGLQAIFSNFISGIIILAENSVKVGDFIEMPSGVTGVVREINIRSTLLTTNDNVDILVPNEEFIKAQVTNWTLREAVRRVRVPFGVAYGTDKETVRAAGLEAAAAVPWTFDDGGGRAPQVWLVEFGDSSLNYELVVWLNEEAVKKPAKVNADYNWAIHSALEKHGLEIPFPQRDLHLRSAEPLTVEIAKKD